MGAQSRVPVVIDLFVCQTAFLLHLNSIVKPVNRLDDNLPLADQLNGNQTRISRMVQNYEINMSVVLGI